MGNLVAAGNEEKPGTSGSSVYRRPARPRCPLYFRYTDLEPASVDEWMCHSADDLDRVRKKLLQLYGAHMTSSQFLPEIAKSLPYYAQGNPTRLCMLLWRRLREQTGTAIAAASDAESESKTPEVVPVVPVVVVNTRDVVDLADTLESCQTPDDRLAFAFYLLSANQVPDSQHSNCDVPVLEACTSFPIEEVVELIGAVLELKGDRFGCLYGQAATQFALHVCEILDGPSSSALTMAQLVDAYESSPFYEELLCY